ncbi:hypothetical protein KW882_00650 [Vibrio parahaemolyticus]
MKDRIYLEGILAAEVKLASFTNKPTAEMDGNYNGNPDFYQYLIDNNLMPQAHEDLGEVVVVASPEYAKTPWSNFGGYAFFVEGALFIIEEEWEAYLKIKFHNQDVSTLEEVNKAIAPINNLIDIAYNQGWKRGRNDKIQELNSVLTPDVV